MIYELILSGLGFFTLPETTVSFSGLSKPMHASPRFVSVMPASIWESSLPEN